VRQIAAVVGRPILEIGASANARVLKPVTVR